MRNLPLVCLVALLGGCSMFGGEKVQKGYVGPASLNQDQVTQLLEQQGYSNITGLHENGSDWIGAATNRSGQQVTFDIDKDGTIHTK
jgi:hypothetical protein